MKKIGLILLMAVFAASMSVSAQQRVAPRGERGQRQEMREKAATHVTPQARAERMAKELELTDAEKAKVQELFEKQDAKRLKHQAEAGKKREEFRKKFEAERKAQDAELEKIIGKEKFQKHETMRTERMEKMKQRRHKAPQHEKPIL
jgi:hypothetical protein